MTSVILTLTCEKAEAIAEFAADCVGDTDHPSLKASTRALEIMAGAWADAADAADTGEIEVDASGLDENQAYLVDVALWRMRD